MGHGTRRSHLPRELVEARAVVGWRRSCHGEPAAVGNRAAVEAAVTRAKATAEELAATPVAPAAPARDAQVVDPFAN